jgi:inositol 1,4,5-triphosphate receptor type 1
MRIELEKSSSRSSWFRISPRYKIRSESEKIRFNDQASVEAVEYRSIPQTTKMLCHGQIRSPHLTHTHTAQVVLESTKTLGQHVHSTIVPLDDESVMPGCLELNIAVTPSVYTIVPHARTVVTDASPGTLRGGDVIQLFHKEISAYLAAEGVFNEPAPREGVHMRTREPDTRRPNRLLPPTSAVSFWQVEHESTPTSGDPIRWDAPVRFRHVPTQLYLTLLPGSTTEEMDASLTRSGTGAESVFSFLPVVREGQHVLMRSFSRIQHSTTGTSQ